jgi:GTPase SAR1 family protein
MATAAGTASGTGSYNFKVVLLGEGCVGKTSVVLRYVQDRFNERHHTTLQVSCLLVNVIFVCKILVLYRDKVCSTCTV